jgi:hypothetical protein
LILILLMNLLEQPANNLKMIVFLEAARLDGGRILSAEARPKFPVSAGPDGTRTENPSSDPRR